MSSLSDRKWFLAVLILGIGAIVAQMLSKGQASRAMIAMARAQPEGLPLARSQRVEIAHEYVRMAHLWDILGISLEVFAVGSWLMSRWRGEPQSPGVLIALFTVFLILWLFLIV